MIGSEDDWDGLKSAFSELLRCPLDRSQGTLSATAHQWPRGLEQEIASDATASGPARLEIYQRQYWFRLFSVMQQEFPLVSHLLGFWEFNGWASDYLVQAPPRSIDIAGVADTFVTFLAAEAQVRSLPRALSPTLLEQAARLDEAYRQILRAPSIACFRPSAEDAALLAYRRLKRGPNVAFFREDWPLVELRDTLTPEDEGPLPSINALRQPNHWALVRTRAGVGRKRLEPLEYMLFEQLQRKPLNEALAFLEERTERCKLEGLPSRVQRWLAGSIERGFWACLGEANL